MTILSKNVIALITGGVFYGLTTPAAPTISAVVDNGDQDSITVTVTGSGTIQLYYRIKYTTTWTAGQNRSGAGNIVQTGLTAGSWYELYITDTIAGIESPPSKIRVIRVVDSDDTTIETALFSILIGDATINSLIATRVYPNIVPQNAPMPAITYQQISGPRDHVMAGPTGLVGARYQINCWASSYAGAKELAEAVRKELDGYSGTVNTRVIEVIILEDEGDMPEVTPGADALKRFGKRLDFIVWFKEPTS